MKSKLRPYIRPNGDYIAVDPVPRGVTGEELMFNVRGPLAKGDPSSVRALSARGAQLQGCRQVEWERVPLEWRVELWR